MTMTYTRPAKVLQTATCCVVLVLHRDITFFEVRRQLTAGGTLRVHKRCESVNQTDRTLMIDVSYTAKSANRNDIATRVCSIYGGIGDVVMSVSKSNVERHEDV